MPRCLWCVTDKALQRLSLSHPYVQSQAFGTRFKLSSWFPQAIPIVWRFYCSLFYPFWGVFVLRICLFFSFGLINEGLDICAGCFNYRMSFCQSGWGKTASIVLMRASKTKWMQMIMFEEFHSVKRGVKFGTLVQAYVTEQLYLLERS